MSSFKKFLTFSVQLSILLVITNCANNPQTATITLPLPSEAYSEGECVVPQVTPIDVNWLVQQKTFYIPVASQFAFRRYAETLLSRPPTSDAELEAMCLTMETAQGGTALNITMVGYDDREFRETCTPGNDGRINCNAVGSSAGVNPTLMKTSANFVVAWDRRSYFIMVRCVEGFYKDFLLVSTKPTVTEAAFNSVLNITRNLGFNERRIQTLGYDNCIRQTVGTLGTNPGSRPSSPIAGQVLTAPYANNAAAYGANGLRVGNRQLPVNPVLQNGQPHFVPPFLDPNGYTLL